MARSITSVAAGRVNTRYLLLAFILAIISGVLAYAAFSRSGGESSSAVTVDVVVAQEPIQVGQRLTASVLAVRSLPADAVGENPLTSIETLEGRQALVPISPGEPILSAKVVGGATAVATSDALAFVIEEGQRGMAVTVDQVSSAGGLVLPGDHVDIFWVPAEQAQVPQDHEGAMLIAENVEVLAVQQQLVEIAPTTLVDPEGTEGETAPASERVRDATAEALPEATTVTLLLPPNLAARVFCAESSGALRLAVRQFGDESPSGLAPVTCVIPANQEEIVQP